ncbi:hypothetical protein AFLA_003985 [Aspergillus flavus NRRL3357]|nr:hypothetical protein AFLA_003985 [Aspergillus flavus NRRL3357]
MEDRRVSVMAVVAIVMFSVAKPPTDWQLYPLHAAQLLAFDPFLESPLLPQQYLWRATRFPGRFSCPTITVGENIEGLCLPAPSCQWETQANSMTETTLRQEISELFKLNYEQ